MTVGLWPFSAGAGGARGPRIDRRDNGLAGLVVLPGQYNEAGTVIQFLLDLHQVYGQLIGKGDARQPVQRAAARPKLDHMKHAAVKIDVGGDDALVRLDDHPLPDEPFYRTDVAGDVTPRVREVLAHVDR